jgi:hypothetical protein
MGSFRQFSALVLLTLGAVLASSQSPDPHDATYQNLNVNHLLTAQTFNLSGVFTLNNLFRPNSRINQAYNPVASAPLMWTNPAPTSLL